MEKLSITLLLLALSFNLPQAQRKLPNIDFLGAGYDVFLGNPRSRSRDPGFRTNKVLALSYSRETLSADGSWLIPDDVQFLQELSCGVNVETNEVRQV